MKKLLTLFAVCMMLAVALSACSGDSTNGTKAGDSSGLGDTAELDIFNVTFHDVKELDEIPFDNAIAEEVHVGARFTLENTSDKAAFYSSLKLFEVYADGNYTGQSVDAADEFGTQFCEDKDKKEIYSSGELEAGDSETFWVAAHIPKDCKELKFRVKSTDSGESSAEFVYKRK